MYIEITSESSSLMNTVLDRYEQLEKLLSNKVVYDNNNKFHEEMYLKGYISLRNTKNGVICKMNCSGYNYYTQFSTINDMRHITELFELI